MAYRTVTAEGDPDYQPPCLLLRGGEIVTAEITWKDTDDNDYTVPANDSTVAGYGPTGGLSQSTLFTSPVFSSPTLTVDVDCQEKAGLYEGYVKLVSSEEPVAILPFYMSVAPFLHGANDATYSPVTVQALQRHLQDWLLSRHELLPTLEFNAALLFEGVREALEMWNSTPPITNQYTSEYFPYHTMLLDGASWMVLRKFRMHLARNRLPVQGAEIDDKVRQAPYDAYASEFEHKFLTAMFTQKRSDDIANGFAVI